MAENKTIVQRALGWLRGLNMLPVLPANYLSNSHGVYAVSPSKFLVGRVTLCVQCAYFKDLFRTQFRTILLFAMPYTPFVYSILKVGFLSTEKQMGGIDTMPYIASMANKQSLRDRAIVEDVRKAMRLLQFTGDGEKLPVSCTVERCCPEPTRFSLMNLRPKATNGRSSGILTGHFTNLLNRLVGVTPKDVSASLRLSYAPIITQMGVS